MKEIVAAYVTKKVLKLIKKHGMKLVLLALIELCDGPEGYMKQLKHDLQVALKNYEDRYK